MRIAFGVRSIAVLAFAVLVANNCAAAETLRVGGTGAATELMRHLGASLLVAAGIKVDIVASLGSSGAIRAVADGVLDIAVSGRRLNREEAAKGLIEIAAVRTAFGFVTSHRHPNALKGADIAEIFTSGNFTWADGTPIRVILRPKSESDTALLGALFPRMSAAIEQARRRPDLPVAATDQDNADLAERVPGSLAGASLTQIETEKRDLRFVAIDGVEPTLENLENGTYPYRKTMYFVVPAVPAPAVARLVAFLQSPQGRRALRETSTLPFPD
jgi:phosphate transport system substrate-binding protein